MRLHKNFQSKVATVASDRAYSVSIRKIGRVLISQPYLFCRPLLKQVFDPPLENYSQVRTWNTRTGLASSMSPSLNLLLLY